MIRSPTGPIKDKYMRPPAALTTPTLPDGVDDAALLPVVLAVEITCDE